MKSAEIAKKIVSCFRNGGILLICGNGGSASMSQHMAAEFMNKFEYDRDPLPAIALTTDTSFLTSCSNDYDFKFVFAKQVFALAKPGDIVIGISTSGKSENVTLALGLAKSKDIETIDFPRKGKSTPEVQEYQLKLMHDIVRKVEKEFI